MYACVNARAVRRQPVVSQSSVSQSSVSHQSIVSQSVSVSHSLCPLLHSCLRASRRASLRCVGLVWGSNFKLPKPEIDFDLPISPLQHFSRKLPAVDCAHCCRERLLATRGSAAECQNPAKRRSNNSQTFTVKSSDHAKFRNVSKCSCCRPVACKEPWQGSCSRMMYAPELHVSTRQPKRRAPRSRELSCAQ